MVMNFVISLIATGILAILCHSTASNIPISEYNTLHNIYDFTNGEAWLWREDTTLFGSIWNFDSPVEDTDPCGLDRWQGLTCDCLPDCHVRSIILAFYNMSGNLPDISNLTMLDTIDMHSNSLKGSLPASLNELTALTSISLANNDFMGEIPNLSNLDLLEDLDFSGNFLMGPIPSSLMGLTGLTSLAIAGNYLISTIPNEITRLANLNSLLLEGNLLSGTIPSDLSSLKRLQIVDIGNNRINDTLESIFKCTNLTSLQLGQNHIRGFIPEHIQDVQNLETLVLASNHLTGKIPYGLRNMTALQNFDIGDNFMNGTVDNAFYCKNISNLRMEYNYFSQTLPSFLHQTPNLRTLYLADTLISGTMPSQIGYLSKLEWLSLIGNSLSKSLPTEISLLSSLKGLFVAINFLTGSIPSEIGFMTTLEYLDLNLNAFTGTLPPSMGNMSNIVDIHIQYNAFNGGIPRELGRCRRLQFLYFDHNSFTGYFPVSIMELPLFFSLSISHNLFSGENPLNIVTNRSRAPLRLLDINTNLFTSTIASSVSRFQNITSLNMSFNILSGTLPHAIGQLQSLNYLQINNNMLSGPLPPSLFFNVTELRYMDLQSNYLHGALPDDCSGLGRLTAMTLFNNMLSQSLPETLSTLSSLVTLLLHDNHFTGPPGRAFSSINQASLQTVDLSSNRFSGTVVMEIFELPNIETVVLLTNCFQSPLPSNICNAKNMTNLFMSGLALACAKNFGIFAPAYETRDIKSSVPSCLFELPKLQNLQLDGNMLNGQIRAGTISSSLQSLSLSHNRITGPIPTSIQEYPFASLDLSYNRLSGAVADMKQLPLVATNTTPATSLTLTVNRLSGKMPDNFYDATSINVVTGNLFGCKSQSDLPRNDPGSRTVICGSSYTNISLYSASAFVGALAALVVFYLLCARLLYPSSLIDDRSRRKADGIYESICDQIVLKIREAYESLHRLVVWMSESMSTSHVKDVLIETRSFVRLLQQMRLLSLVIGAGIVFVMLPIYIALKFVNGGAYATHAYEYAFTPSLAFMDGLVPAEVMLVVIIAGLLAVLFMINATHDQTRIYQEQMVLELFETDQPVDLSTAENVINKIRGWWGVRDPAPWSVCFKRRLMFYLVIPLGNAIVMVFVNGVYVYLLLDSLAAITFAYSIFLVAFKLSWNVIVVPKILERALEWIYALPDGREHPRPAGEGLGMHAVMLLFNTVLAPWMANEASDSSCYLAFFVEMPSVSLTYTYNACLSTVALTGGCLIEYPVRITSVFDPPFSYSYQCSSSLLYNYIPIFVAYYVFTGFVTPTLSLLSLYSISKPRVNNLRAERRAPSTGSGDDVSAGRDDSTASTGSDTEQMRFIDLLLRMYTWIPGALSPIQRAERDSSSALVNAHKISCNLVTHFCVLLTYGTAYPPLGFVIVLAVIMTTLQWEIVVGRFLLHCETAPAHLGNHWKRTLEENCTGTARILEISLRLVVVIVTMFFAIFLYDMAGGKSNSSIEGGLWVPLVLILVPGLLGVGLLVHGGYKLFTRVVKERFSGDRALPQSDYLVDGDKDGREPSSELVKISSPMSMQGGIRTSARLSAFTQQGHLQFPPKEGRLSGRFPLKGMGMGMGMGVGGDAGKRSASMQARLLDMNEDFGQEIH